MNTTTTTRFPVFDGHNDVLFELYYPGRRETSFFERGAKGHIDLPRAIEGGFGGGFFAVYVPPEPQNIGLPEYQPVVTETGYTTKLARPVGHPFALESALALMAKLFKIEREAGGRVKIVRSAAEIEECLRAGVLAIVLHFEGAEPIGTSLDELYVFHEAGLRSLGLVWSRPNKFATGVPFRFPSTPDTGVGLTDDGKALVRACNELRIMVDLAHLNEKGFWDVARTSKAPLVATHTAAHALCPSTRNLTDKQLDAIRDSNGMVGINFNVRDLRADGKSVPDTSLDEIVRHVEYVASRVGIERVGFGSDFDGATVSSRLPDVSGLPKLIDALRKHGYDDDTLTKLAHANWVRVLRETWGE